MTSRRPGRKRAGWRTRVRAGLQSEAVRSAVAWFLPLLILVPLWSADVFGPTLVEAEDTPERFDDLLRATETTVLMIAWILYAGLYLWMTHLAFSHLPAGRLRTVAAGQHRRRLSLSEQLKGVATAEQLTIMAAASAAMFSILIAQSGEFRSSAALITLGLLTVACAWGLMVTSFALQYMRMHAAGEPMDFSLDEEPVFSDYLTLSVLTSTLLGHSVTSPSAAAAAGRCNGGRRCCPSASTR